MQTVTELTQQPVRGPKVQLAPPAKSIRKWFTLKEPLSKTLSEYAQFLSEYHQSKIQEDSIIETFLLKLARDRAFRVWKSKRSA